MSQKTHSIVLALFAAAQLTGCVAVTGTGATVDPDAVDAAATDKSKTPPTCAPGTSSTAEKPCVKEQARK